MVVAASINSFKPKEKKKNRKVFNFLHLCITWKENKFCLAAHVFSHAFVHSHSHPSPHLHQRQEIGPSSPFSVNGGK